MCVRVCVVCAKRGENPGRARASVKIYYVMSVVLANNMNKLDNKLWYITGNVVAGCVISSDNLWEGLRVWPQLQHVTGHLHLTTSAIASTVKHWT